MLQIRKLNKYVSRTCIHILNNETLRVHSVPYFSIRINKRLTYNINQSWRIKYFRWYFAIQIKEKNILFIK